MPIMIIEAVFEDMALKKKIFAELDRIAKPGAVLATNTSTLDVDEIARATSRPGDVVGMHFFSPANVMKLLETVRGKATSHEALKTAVETGRRIGKVGVISGVCFGFIGNRMLGRRSTEAERIILEGALPQEVDGPSPSSASRWGRSPWATSPASMSAGASGRAPAPRREISDALYEMGRYGQKTGKGYYIYEEGSRVPRPDPEVDALIVAHLQAPRHRAPPDLQGGDRRADDLSDDQRRRAHPRGRHRHAARRYRRHLGLWLWLAGLSRRADALCRQVGLQHIADRLSFYAEPDRRQDAGARAAADAAGERGQGFGSLSAKG